MFNANYKVVVTLQDFTRIDGTWQFDEQRQYTRVFDMLALATQGFYEEANINRVPYIPNCTTCGKVELFKIGVQTPIETHKFGAARDLFIDL